MRDFACLFSAQGYCSLLIPFLFSCFASSSFCSISAALPYLAQTSDIGFGAQTRVIVVCVL